MKRKVITYVLGGLLFLILVSAQTTQQHETTTEEITTEGHEEQGATDEGFSPADFIFDHVLDAYEWHILSYDDFHLSIPLPVIIYSESKGLNIFMFSK